MSFIVSNPPPAYCQIHEMSLFSGLFRRPLERRRMSPISVLESSQQALPIYGSISLIGRFVPILLSLQQRQNPHPENRIFRKKEAPLTNSLSSSLSTTLTMVIYTVYTAPLPYG